MRRRRVRQDHFQISGGTFARIDSGRRRDRRIARQADEIMALRSELKRCKASNAAYEARFRRALPAIRETVSRIKSRGQIPSWALEPLKELGVFFDRHAAAYYDLDKIEPFQPRPAWRGPKRRRW